METINDILSEMRSIKTTAPFWGSEFHELADRIEAAWEREAKAIATENAVLPAVCITKPVGNAAKMREAMENSNGLLEELSLVGEWSESAREQIAENKAALSAPPRNCDRFAIHDEAFREWMKTWESHQLSFSEWLFAEAKGE